MKLTHLNEPIFTESDLIQEIYKGNLSKISLAKIDSTDLEYLSLIEFIKKNNLDDWPCPEPYFGEVRTKEEFDSYMQTRWYIPENYKSFDIKNYLLSLCTNNIEKERVANELDLFTKNNMINLLKFLKYLVDFMRENNILWGVGRGSSVSSYCLFLLGIHKIDSIKYNLDINEFLR